MTAPPRDLDGVEDVLRAHPDVEETALFQAADGRWIAAVRPRLHCNPVDLRDELWDATPEGGGLPDLVVVLEQIPRATDGTVAAGEIGPDALYEAGACGFESPVTATEQGVAAIWGEVLGRRRVAAEDNFLDLGGDSMTATLLLDLTNERFGADLTLDDLLELPSLRAVAARIDGGS